MFCSFCLAVGCRAAAAAECTTIWVMLLFFRVLTFVLLLFQRLFFVHVFFITLQGYCCVNFESPLGGSVKCTLPYLTNTDPLHIMLCMCVWWIHSKRKGWNVLWIMNFHLQFSYTIVSRQWPTLITTLSLWVNIAIWVMLLCVYVWQRSVKAKVVLKIPQTTHQSKAEKIFFSSTTILTSTVSVTIILDCSCHI